MSKIISLKSTNFKGLKAVEIRPDGNMVAIHGKNGAGKSCVLDSIAVALGGVDKNKTPKPVRDGEAKAEIVLETEDLTVTRRFTAAGGTSLLVKSKDGATFSAGQTKVDSLLGKLSLDPFAFTQLDAKKQREQLLELVELPFDLAEIDAEHKRIFADRADVGRDGKAIGDVVVDFTFPAVETSAGEIIAKIRSAEDLKRENAEVEFGVQIAANEVANLTAQIAELTVALGSWTATLEERTASLDSLHQPADTAALEAQLADVERMNADIRANNAAIQQAKKKDSLRDECNKLSDELAAIEKRKADGLAAAKFPVDGLSFDTDGVTFNGVPFTQVNSGIQLETSMALAAALNPALRVIRIAEGSLLDEDALKRVKEFADKHDFQIWMEVVGEGDGTGIIIEDGEIA